MSKRSAVSNLNHDNWNDEEAKEEMGVFQKASANELKMRSIRRAKRRGGDGDEQVAPSVFKNFTAFGTSSPSSTVPSFSFLNSNSETAKLTTPNTFPSFSFGNTNATDSSKKTNSEKPPSFSFANAKDNCNTSIEKPPPYSFGHTKDSSNSNSGKPPTFSFGNTKDSSNTDSGKPPTFSFGNTKDSSNTDSGKPPTFSFGNTKENDINSGKLPSFSFGNCKDSTSSSSSEKAPTFSFSNTKETKNTADKPSTFSFGNKTDTTKTSFNVGGAKETSNLDLKKSPISAIGNTSDASKTASFSFGSPKGSPNTNSEKTPMFSFGSAKDSSTVSSGKLPSFSFGNASETSNQINSDKLLPSFNSPFNNNKSTPPQTNTSSVPMFKSGSHSVEAKPKQIPTPSSDEIKSKKEENVDLKSGTFKFGIGTEKMPDKTASPSLPTVGFNLGKTSVSPSSFKFGIKTASKSDASQSPASKTYISDVKTPKSSSESVLKPSTSVGNSNNEVNKTEGSSNSGKSSDQNILFLANLRALNIGVVNWIKQHMDKNEFINLCPIFDDYKTHFHEIKRKYDCRSSKNKETSQNLAKTSENKNESKVTDENNSKLDESSKLKPTPELHKAGPLFSFGSSSCKSNQPNGNENSKQSSFTGISNVKSGNDKFSFSSVPSRTPPQSTPSEKMINVDPEKKELNVKKTGFSFESSSSETKSLFSFGSKETPSSKGFSFGASNDSKPGFSFNSGAHSNSFGLGSSEDKKSTGFSFGSSNSSPKGFNFSTSAPLFQFPGSSSVDNKETTESKTEKEQEESDEPPKVEVKEVKEEDAVYEKKVKLFLKKDDSYVERGVGTLYLKPAEEKTQLVVRALTNLGNILLNIILNDSIPTQRVGKNNVLLVCIANPPVDAKHPNVPVSMLIRVKTGEDADELLSKIDEYKKK